MNPNAYAALGLAVAVPLAPVLVPALPFLAWWWRREWVRGRADGYVALPRCLARSLCAHAEAVLPPAPDGDATMVARNVDRYLAAVRSPRHWRTYAVLLLHEFAPCLRLRRPLSRLAPADRLRFLEGPMATTRGLFAIAALVRQLVHMGYYADDQVARRVGFMPMGQRGRRPATAARPKQLAS